MKIDDYSQILGIDNTTSKSSAAPDSDKGANGASFAEQLAQVIQNAYLEATSTDNKGPELLDEDLSKGLSKLESEHLAKVPPKIAEMNEQQTLSALDTLLGMLEEYETALANPAISLKEIDPMVKAMQKQANDMEASLDKIDSQLKPLTSQIIGQAQIEAIKFERGDYI